MIPRILIPEGARLSADSVASARRRPTNLDERTLVPSALPLVPLDGKTSIPSNLPLEAIAARMVVPRDINVELVQKPEESTLPPQPTEMDERITIPMGIAAPEELPPLPPVSEELVEPNIISTGEVSFLPPVERDYRGNDERVATWILTFVYGLMLLSLPFTAKYFKSHVPTREEEDIARQQMTVLLPPGALESLKPTPPPAPHAAVRVDPRVINKIAPPAPTPPPPTPQPEVPKRELPSTPTPQSNVAQPPPSAPPTQGDLPKPQVRLENPDMPVPQKGGLILPKTPNSAGGLIRDASRAVKPNAPAPTGGGIPVVGGTGKVGGRGGAGGSVGGGIQMLTDTEGVDFNDYFRRIYYIVYNNWMAVMPPSVSLGEQGKLALHVKIMRDGSVPEVEPVLLYSSGKEPLDRAAISSIRSSNPFPPLPPQFKGPYIEIIYSYYYNLQPPNQ